MSRQIEALWKHILHKGETISIPVEKQFMEAVRGYREVGDFLEQPDTKVTVVGYQQPIIDDLTQINPELNITLVEKDPRLIEQASHLPYFTERGTLINGEYPNIDLPQQDIILAKHIFPFINPVTFALAAKTKFLEREGVALASTHQLYILPTLIQLRRGVMDVEEVRPLGPYKIKPSLRDFGRGALFAFRR